MASHSIALHQEAGVQKECQNCEHYHQEEGEHQGTTSTGPWSAGEHRIADGIRSGRLVLLKRLAADVAFSPGIARNMDDGCATDAKLALVGKHDFAPTNLATATRDLHVADFPGDQACPFSDSS